MLLKTTTLSALGCRSLRGCAAVVEREESDLIHTLDQVSDVKLYSVLWLSQNDFFLAFYHSPGFGVNVAFNETGSLILR